MAKTRPQVQADADQPTAEPTDGVSLSAYFRRIFTENPKWLEGSSNKEVLQRWLDDHSDQTEVPNRVKYILSNVKSVLRRKQRQEPGRRPKEEKATGAKVTRPGGTAAKALETLEEKIDECLSLARNLDREGLTAVLVALRAARNQVVWKLGE